MGRVVDCAKKKTHLGWAGEVLILNGCIHRFPGCLTCTKGAAGAGKMGGSPGLLSKLQHATQLTCAKSEDKEPLASDDACAIRPLVINYGNAKSPTNGALFGKASIMGKCPLPPLIAGTR